MVRESEPLEPSPEPLPIEERVVLKSYAERHSMFQPKFEVSHSGYACPNFLFTTETVTRTRMVSRVEERDFLMKNEKDELISVTRPVTIEEEVEYVEEVSVKDVSLTEDGSCPGELMFIEPAEYHPELHPLRRAKCGHCNWRGWV